MNVICPQCQKDDTVQKVSAVVAGGHASGSFSGYSGGVVSIDGNVGSTSNYTTLKGTSSTDLARILAAPSVPVRKPEGIYLSGCLGMMLSIPIACSCVFLAYYGLFGAMSIIDNPKSTLTFVSIVVSVFLFICMCSGLFWILLKDARKDKDKRLKEIESQYTIEKLSWDNAIIRWNRLYYCHRDGLVFDPENNQTCQPSQIQEFVFEK